MRTTVLAAIIPMAYAVWDPKLCNGAGGCSGTAWNAPNPWYCSDGTRLNTQQTAEASFQVSTGKYTLVSKEEFPKTCYAGVPPADATLVKSTTPFKQTRYDYITFTCNNPTPEVGNCYHKNPNPAGVHFCQLLDTKGAECKMNATAGYCERWGYSTVNPQCEFWRPGLVDLPNRTLP